MILAQKQRFIDEPGDVDEAARAIASGEILGHAFGNLYAITTRPDAATVRRVNAMKGRPPEQTANIVTSRPHIADLFDWGRLPEGVERARVADLIDDCFERGPLGFRGPASAILPRHLTSLDDGLATTVLVGPGYRCASNALVDRAMALLPDRFLCVSSANKARPRVAGEDEPAHFEAQGLARDFGREPDFHLLRHRNEAVTRADYADYAPTSTTIVAFHKAPAGEDARPTLTVERHGSLPMATLATIAARHGFAVAAGPKAQRRLVQRSYMRASISAVIP